MTAPAILLAYDDSPAARAARRWAIGHAKTTGARVLLTYVVSSISEWELAAVQIDPGPIRRHFQERLDTAWSEPLRKAGVAYETRLLVGRPAEAVLQCARREDVDLIVVGMTTRGVLHEIIAGSTATAVLHHAQRPVVAVPASWQTDTDGS
ncbi:MAG: universal stress protein [Actinobacteria bacterium]|nr:universal stress protein [Actinomycetota bacterium]